MDAAEYAHRIPKVELHVHLEGSIQPGTLLELARRNHVSLPADDESGLRQFYQFQNFSHFIEVFLTITRCLRTTEDYRLIAYEFGRQCSLQNIRYAEVTFTIFTNMMLAELSWQVILEALNAGREQAAREFGVWWQWVFDIVRSHPETQEQVLEIALAARSLGVVALGLGGNEAGHPPELFTQTFERALAAGLHSVPHSGENAGPASIWSSLSLLHAERIGHGVRAIEDAHLVEYLKEQRIPLELCPTSNVALGIYSDYTHHPFRRLWEAGVLVTVNSDDPPMFGTTLENEYLVLMQHFGFTPAELTQISLNAVQASFLPQSDKINLQSAFRQEIKALGGDYE